MSCGVLLTLDSELWTVALVNDGEGIGKGPSRTELLDPLSLDICHSTGRDFFGLLDHAGCSLPWGPCSGSRTVRERVSPCLSCPHP